jgi:RNA-binding protein YlmH
MQEQDRQAQKRFLDLSRRAFSQRRYTYTDFLTTAEQDVLSRTALDASCAAFELCGGFDGAERKLARFGGEALCGYTEDWPVACARIAPALQKFADTLTHRDFLGALVSLGLRRGVLGDIVLADNTAFVFCLDSVAGFIAGELTQVRHTTVTCAILEEPPALVAREPEEKSVNVASERLDAVAAAVFGLSRSDAQALFKDGKVFVNARLTENASCRPSDGDIVSVRGHGRFVFGGVSGSSRKGRLFVTVRVY